jgi:hypothetical protein
MVLDVQISQVLQDVIKTSDAGKQTRVAAVLPESIPLSGNMLTEGAVFTQGISTAAYQSWRSLRRFETSSAFVKETLFMLLQTSCPISRHFPSTMGSTAFTFQSKL